MINADLKQWGGERPVNGPYKVDYPRLVRHARKNLGLGGVVGIPNARGQDNSLGQEYRFEELLEMASKTNKISYLGDGRVFRDNEFGIWFVKGQEMRVSSDNLKLTYLMFNIPLGQNLKEDCSSAFDNSNVIKLLNLPSCKNAFFSDYLRKVLFVFDGIITHAGNAAILPCANFGSQIFYDSHVKGKTFETKQMIGQISVSGGHRDLEDGFFQNIFAPISIGSSYTIFPDFNGNTLDDFNDWLRSSIQNSQDSKNLVKKSSMRETVFGHILKLY